MVILALLWIFIGTLFAFTEVVALNAEGRSNKIILLAFVFWVIASAPLVIALATTYIIESLDDGIRNANF